MKIQLAFCLKSINNNLNSCVDLICPFFAIFLSLYFWLEHRKLMSSFLRPPTYSDWLGCSAALETWIREYKTRLLITKWMKKIWDVGDDSGIWKNSGVMFWWMGSTWWLHNKKVCDDFWTFSQTVAKYTSNPNPAKLALTYEYKSNIELGCRLFLCLFLLWFRNKFGEIDVFWWESSQVNAMVIFRRETFQINHTTKILQAPSDLCLHHIFLSRSALHYLWKNNSLKK